MNYRLYIKILGKFKMAGTFLDLKKTCVTAVVLRALFMIYGEWQDATMVVKYTDIDYEVFTDAARHVASGNSPYARATYRYTPLLSWILLPNITLHKAFGKLFFVFCDIIAGYLIYLILKTKGSVHSTAVQYSWLWFFNPMIITVSTRGNAESVLAVLVLSTLYFMLQKRFFLSAVMLAFSVHFKIYPIIYALPLYLTVGSFARPKEGHNSGKDGLLKVIFSHISHPYQLLYAAISGSIFLLINGIMYYM
jgi:phosphatidylinositol glycan class M